MYWNLTSERVVTMEYVPGIKINNLDEIDRRAIDRNLLAKRSAEAYLTQLCRHGFFHCDPHPGSWNRIITTTSAGVKSRLRGHLGAIPGFQALRFGLWL